MTLIMKQRETKLRTMTKHKKKMLLRINRMKIRLAESSRIKKRDKEMRRKILMKKKFNLWQRNQSQRSSCICLLQMMITRYEYLGQNTKRSKELKMKFLNLRKKM